MKRIILEMGSGVDLEGEDYTKAACRAVRDAMAHSYLPMFRTTGLSADAMAITVTLAAQRPDAIDTATVARELPYGSVTVETTVGGLDITHRTLGGRSVIVNAAIDVRHPMA